MRFGCGPDDAPLEPQAGEHSLRPATARAIDAADDAASDAANNAADDAADDAAV